MPLINGLKMACEPCIRGHRSTKCTHANERLMVPVRKPGRPLSACPHPKDQVCGCGSVTAAIPRKQTCHCGGDTITPEPASAGGVPQDPNPTEVPSPTQVAFKVQKPPRPQSSRKHSFDPANFERMDMNSVNIIPFEQKQHSIPMAFSDGYGHPQPFGYVQYANLQTQYIPMSLQHPLHAHPAIVGTNGFDRNELEHVIESPLATPTKMGNGELNGETNPRSCCGPPPPPTVNVKINGTTNGSSCCAPKQPSHSHSSSSASSVSEPQDIQAGSCCVPKATQLPEKETVSNHATPEMPHRILPQNGISFNPAMYPQYVPQATVFTYPPTYGSFQNPLQPSAWRQSIRPHNFAVPQVPNPMPSVQYSAPIVQQAPDTVHMCSCGDTCQCVGCAAHPYNEATQSYVRSAWFEQPSPSGEMYANGNRSNGHPVNEINGTNGNLSGAPQTVETVSSPAAHTPSSTNSNNGDEPNLAESDFLFVSYAFPGEGCEGDNQTCPCGDDCQCLGCTVHRQPAISCQGSEETCPCGDGCQCTGCEFHAGRNEEFASS